MISLFKVNERIGDSFRPVREPKRANRRILWVKKQSRNFFSVLGGGGGGGWVLNTVLYGEALERHCKK